MKESGGRDAATDDGAKAEKMSHKQLTPPSLHLDLLCRPVSDLQRVATEEHCCSPEV